jgi:hypothetical protein
MPRVLFAFHGMGRQLDGWGDSIAAKLDEVAARHARFRDRFGGRPFTELFTVVPIGYDVCFRDKTEAWQRSTDELHELDDVLGAGAVGRLATWLTTAASADEQKFFWSHAADVLQYVSAPDVRTRVRVECLAQVTDVLQGDLVQPSVLAHSLGTKVAHDTLHMLGTAAGGPVTEAFAVANGYRFRTIATVANVGALLSEVVRDLPKPDASIVKPIGTPAGVGQGTGYCERYLNFRHRLDPFTLLRPFVGPAAWGTRYETSARLLEHFPPDWNPHGYEHFLDHPAVHMPLLRALLPHTEPLFSDADVAAAVAAYAGPPLPPCQRVVADFKRDLETLARSFDDSAGAQNVVGIVQAAARFHARIEEAKRACAKVV